MRRRDFLVFALGAALGGTARAQTPPQWPIGTWIGEIKNLKEKYSNARRLVVVAIAGEDVTLRYGFVDSTVTATTHGRLRGGELRFLSVGADTGDNTIILKRGAADDELVGTWQSARIGKTYPIVFRRQK
jgi:hypothetical protein